MSPEDFAEYLGDLSEYCESGSFEEPLREVLPVLNDGFAENFMRAEGPDGTPWPPRKDKLPHPLLILSGALIEAVRDPGGSGNIHRVEARDLETGVSTSVIAYAAAQNFGNPDGNLPARTFLYASESTLDTAIGVFADSAYELLFG